jgi:hypothetical protein
MCEIYVYATPQYLDLLLQHPHKHSQKPSKWDHFIGGEREGGGR